MKIYLLLGAAIFATAALIHTFNIMFSPKILVFREDGYECVTLRGSGGASCYRIDLQKNSGN